MVYSTRQEYVETNTLRYLRAMMTSSIDKNLVEIPMCNQKS